MAIFDIYNQAHLQRVVQVALRTQLEEQNPVVRQMVTMVPTDHDKIRLQRAEIKAFGRAKPKAFGATPPVFVPKIRYSETEIELLPIHEMSPVDERLLRKLEDPDPEISVRAGADATLRATALQMRNEIGWDVITMNAILTGQMNILFADDPEQGFNIDYGYDPLHFVTAGTSWATLASSKPIDNLRAIQLLLANDAGDYGIHFWMTSNTMRGIVESAQAKELLTGNDRAQNIATIDDVTGRLYEPGRVQWHISDSGWRDESYARGLSAHTKFLPDGKVIVTTADPFQGEPLIEVFDGRVAVPVSEFAKPQLRRGSQSWVKLDTNSLTTYYHYSSTRMPRINRPECMAILDVVGVPA